MPSRTHTASAASLALSAATTSISRDPSLSQKKRHWVEPAALPNYGDVSSIAGNVPDYVKQLNNNTYFSYGVGDEDCFGHKVGKALKFVEVNVNRKEERQGRLEATTVAEVTVSKHMLNGAGMLHGGCVAYIIDNCCSTPLVVLGLLQNVNGVGVTQGMNILFHSPAPIPFGSSFTPEQWYKAENYQHLGIPWRQGNVFTMRDPRQGYGPDSGIRLPEQDAAQYLKTMNTVSRRDNSDDSTTPDIYWRPLMIV